MNKRDNMEGRRGKNTQQQYRETERNAAKSMSQQSEDDTERRSAVSNTCFHDNNH